MSVPISWAYSFICLVLVGISILLSDFIKPKESSIVQKITMSIMYLGIGGIFLLLFIQSARLINTRFFKFTDAYFLTDFWLTRIYLF
tara:strand:+ start:325 stop:585 length:261 start_codon:yes stop_codon:yes gene_type:complete